MPNERKELTKEEMVALREKIYQQVENLVAPILTMYHKDLYVYDRDAIKASDVPFLHFSGETGTHIVFLNETDAYPPPGEEIPYLFGKADRIHMLKDNVACVETLVDSWNRSKLMLYADNEGVRKIDKTEALNIIHDYTAKMLHEWSTEPVKEGL